MGLRCGPERAAHQEQPVNQQRGRVWLWGVFGAVVLVVLLLPKLIPLGWRLLHGSHFHFSGWQVTAPAGWYLAERDPNLVLVRLPWLYPLRSTRASYIVVVHNELGVMLSNELHYARWREVSLRREVASGLELAGERELEVAGRRVHCLEFARPGESVRVRAECFHPQEAAAASYDGDRARLNEFYTFLSTIRRAPE
jgi:hypothetical protein